MDRFMMRLSIGYPDREQELRLAAQVLAGKAPDTIHKVCQVENLLKMRGEVTAIGVNEMVLGYMEDLVAATREEERFLLGASPRALLALLRASQANAYINGRDFVKPDDVKEMAEPVLLHRLVLSSEAKLRKENPSKILHSIVNKIKIPV